MTIRFFDRRLAGEAARYRRPLALTIALSLAGGVLLVIQARLLSLAIARARSWRARTLPQSVPS